MKRKLTQIFLLLALTAGVGTFVTSCKDTNEDLYNELRQKHIDENASLKAAFDQQVANLQKQIDQYQAALAAFKSCDCDEMALRNLIAGLQTQIDNINTEIQLMSQALSTSISQKADQATVDLLNQTVTTLQGQATALETALTNVQGQYTTLAAEVAGNKAAQDALKEVVDDLKTQLASVKSCSCDYTDVITRLATLEAQMVQAEKDAQAAMALATAADGKADAATSTATSAKEIAENANVTASEAKSAADAAVNAVKAATDAADAAMNYAKQVEELAKTAGIDAAEAKKIAEIAQQVANDALTTATTATTTANNALTFASTANSLANENKGKIETMQGCLTTLENLIKANKDLIDKNASAIDKNSDQIAANVKDLQKQAESIAQNAADIRKNHDLIDALQTQMSTFTANAQGILDEAAAAASMINAKATQIDELGKAVDDLKTLIEGEKTEGGTTTGGIKQETEKLQTSFDEFTNKVNNILGIDGGGSGTGGGSGQGGSSVIQNMTVNLDSIKGAIKGINATTEQFAEDLSGLKSRVATLEAGLASAKAECAANLAVAKAYADEQVAALNATLTAAIAAAKAENKELIDANTGKIDANTVSINKNADDIAALNTSYSDLKAIVDKINSCECTDKWTESITNILTDIEQIKSDIATKEAALSDLIAGNTSAIQTNKDAIAGNTSDIAANKAAIEAQKTALETAKTELEGKLTTAQQELETKLAEVKEELITKINTDILNVTNELNTTNNTLTSYITENNGKIQGIETSISSINGSIDNINGKIDNINGNIDNINGSISDINAKINGLYTNDQIDALVNTVKSYAENEVAKLNATDEAAKARMDVIGDSIKTAFTDIAAAVERITVLENSTVKVADYEAKVSELNNLIDANTTSIATINTKMGEMNDAITTLQTSVSALEGRMTTAEADLVKALEGIETLKSDVTAIQEYLAKQVTGILIQNTTNPFLGSFSVPFDVQSNLLIAYYGLPKTKVEFPTYDNSSYVRPEEALTEADMQMIGGVDVFTSRANVPLMYATSDARKGYGAAGRIYMTINPNTANLDGLKLDIVNTQDEVSGITLDGLKKSDELLQFGITRADNGFYEAEAVVKAGDVDEINRPDLKAALSDAKDAISEIAKNRLDADLNKVATDVYDIVSGLKFDRSGLKCSYTENGKEHAVYSQYNLGATAFKPLGLSALKDLDYKGLPGVARVNNVLDRISNNVHSQVHTFFKDFTSGALVEKISNLEIKDIEFPKLTDAQLQSFVLHMDTTFVMGGLSYHLVMPIEEEIPIKINKDLTIPVDIKGVEFQVPVKFSQDVDVDVDVTVDLSQLYVITPFIQVTGKGSGQITDGIKDEDENLVTELVIPIINDQTNQLEGYTTIPLENFVVTTEISADNSSQAGQKIYLNGEAIATAKASTTIDVDKVVDGTVDIKKDIYYTLEYEDTYKFSTTIDKVFYFGDNDTDSKSFTLKFNYDMRDAAKDLYGTATGAIEDINDGLLNDVRDIIKEVNKTLDEVNKYESQITDAVDDYITKIKNYINKIDTKVTNLINSANSRLQPVLFGVTSAGTKQLSGAKNYPTVLTKDIKFVATTWNLEILVPLARKHVAVTNVYNGTKSAQGGDSDCLAQLQAANANAQMNKVFNGTERDVNVKNLKPGYTYEIAYSALDFEGKMATRKYYVTVK